MLSSQILSRIPKSTIQTIVRQAHDMGGVPSRNLPFSIENRYRLTALFIAFFGSGLGIPYIMLRHHLTKQA